MWLVVSLTAALAASAAYFLAPAKRKELRLGLLSLMLWGLAIMVLVDRAIAYFEGEELISATTDGMIASSILLGFAMLIPIFAIWAVATFTPLRKNLS